jgi:hypothetical protein
MVSGWAVNLKVIYLCEPNIGGLTLFIIFNKLLELRYIFRII